MRLRIIVLAVLLSTLLLQGTSRATALADLEIMLDWSGLVVAADPSATLPPAFSQYKGLSSEGWINGDPMNAAYAHTGLQSTDASATDVDWSDVSLGNGIGANSAVLTTTDDLLIAHSISASSSDGDTSGWINGTIHRNMEFIPDTDAVYTFTLPYEIDSQLNRNDYDLENASNGGLVHLTLFWHEFEPGVVDDWHMLDEQRMDLSYSLENQVLLSSFTDTGTVSVTASLLAGEIYTLNTQQGVSGFTRSIPEPASILLLGMGIAGLSVSGIRSRK